MIQAKQHTDEQRLRTEIVRICRCMSSSGLASGWAGNVSARLGPDRLLITPAGVPKSLVTEEDLLLVDDRGRVLDAPPGLRPTSELPMHLCVYRRRPDVAGAVHAHPVHAVALSIAGDALSRNYVPEAIVALGRIAVTPYATPSTEENERVVSEVIDRHDTIVLKYHGSLTVGRTVTDAYLRLETLEHTSRIVALVEQLGGGPELEPSWIAKLVAQRARARQCCAAEAPAQA